jgi:hypothetical protein
MRQVPDAPGKTPDIAAFPRAKQRNPVIYR